MSRAKQTKAKKLRLFLARPRNSCGCDSSAGTFHEWWHCLLARGSAAKSASTTPPLPSLSGNCGATLPSAVADWRVTYPPARLSR